MQVMNQLTTRDKVFKALRLAALKHRMLGFIIGSWAVKETSDCPTFMTSGKELFYNPEWAAQWNIQQLAFIILHEAGHVFLGHHLRLKGLNPSRANIAFDLALNSLVRHNLPPGADGRALIDNGTFPGEGMFAQCPPDEESEYYWDMLFKDLPEPPPQPKSSRNTSQDNDEGNPEQGEGDGQGQGDEDEGEGQGQGQDGEDQEGDGQGQGQGEGEGEGDGSGDGSGQGQGDSGNSQSGGGGGGQGKDAGQSGGGGSGSGQGQGNKPPRKEKGKGNPGSGQGQDDGDDQQNGNGISQPPPKIKSHLGDIDMSRNFGDVCSPEEGDRLMGRETDSDSDEEERDWKRTIGHCAQIAKDMGNEGGIFAELAKAMVEESKLDWKALLRQYLTKYTRQGFTYQRPNRRFASSDYVLPCRRSKSVGRGLVVVDTSGSMGDAECSVSLNEISAICAMFPKAEVDMVQCDTAVVGGVKRFQRWDFPLRVPTEWYGRGGTDLDPAFRWAKARKHEYDWMVVVSDMYWYAANAENPTIPVIWLNTSIPLEQLDPSCNKPKFGVMLKVEIER